MQKHERHSRLGAALVAAITATTCTDHLVVGIQRDGAPDAAAPLVGAPPAAVGSGRGLKAEYFDNLELRGVPAVVRIDPRLDHHWQRTPPEGVGLEFSARWTGELEVPETGEYAFEVSYDDGLRLWLAGVERVERWSDAGGGEETFRVTLDGGRRYPLRVELTSRGVDAVIFLKWSTPRMPLDFVPSARLYPAL